MYLCHIEISFPGFESSCNPHTESQEKLENCCWIFLVYLPSFNSHQRGCYVKSPRNSHYIESFFLHNSWWMEFYPKIYEWDLEDVYGSDSRCNAPSAQPTDYAAYFLVKWVERLFNCFVQQRGSRGRGECNAAGVVWRDCCGRGPDISRNNWCGYLWLGVNHVCHAHNWVVLMFQLFQLVPCQPASERGGEVELS